MQPSYGPPPTGGPYQHMGYQPYVEQKSKIGAALFAFFLGQFGAHGFYLGNSSMGTTCLLISVGSWIVMIGSILLSFLILPVITLVIAAITLAVMHMIYLVQAILYLAASDYDFQRKYVIEKRWF